MLNPKVHIPLSVTLLVLTVTILVTGVILRAQAAGTPKLFYKKRQELEMHICCGEFITPIGTGIMELA